MNESVRNRRRRLAIAAVGGVVVYVVLDVIAQLQPPHYSVLHQPESDLGVGPYAFVMNANFVVRGLTALAVTQLVGGRSSRRRERIGAVLIAGWGICSALLAAFPTDITTEPFGSSTATSHGQVHLVLALTGFFAAAVGIVLVGSGAITRFQHVRLMVVAPLILLIVFLVAAATTDLFGLFERLFIAAVLAWTAAVGADRLTTGVQESGRLGQQEPSEIGNGIR